MCFSKPTPYAGDRAVACIRARFSLRNLAFATNTPYAGNSFGTLRKKKLTVFLVQADAGSVNSKPNAKAGISKAKTVVDKNNVHGGSWDMSAFLMFYLRIIPCVPQTRQRLPYLKFAVKLYFFPVKNHPGRSGP